MDILIRNVDDKIVRLLDEIVAKEKYDSRNDLLLEIVRLYATSHHEFFAKSISPTVLFLCKEALTEQQNYTDTALNLTYNVNAKVLKMLEKLYALFAPDLEMHDNEV